MLNKYLRMLVCSLNAVECFVGAGHLWILKGQNLRGVSLRTFVKCLVLKLNNCSKKLKNTKISTGF